MYSVSYSMFFNIHHDPELFDCALRITPVNSSAEANHFNIFNSFMSLELISIKQVLIVSDETGQRWENNY